MAWVNVYSGKEELVMTSKFLRNLTGISRESRWIRAGGELGENQFIKCGQLNKDRVEHGMLLDTKKTELIHSKHLLSSYNVAGVAPKHLRNGLHQG